MLATALDSVLDAERDGLSRGPLPAVLDAAFLLSGLHYQLSSGMPPGSVGTAECGALRLYMEYDALAQAGQRLPGLADQLGVAPADLRRILNESWLPHVGVVRLPPYLRQVDPRALAVCERNAGDYPAAALAALLSPCLLLTQHAKHFAPLGVRARGERVDSVMAVVAVNVGDVQLPAEVVFPAVPCRSVAASAEAAVDRFGPVACVVLAMLGIGGATWYRELPPERRQKVKRVVSQIGAHLADEYEQPPDDVHRARHELGACMVPSPEQRSALSALVREMAISPTSLSAKQVAEMVTPSLRPKVADLRVFLRKYEHTVFKEVRRGGFALGSHYELPG
ncbi:MAG TPA: hypothetical protein VGS19_20080 [Streptosporangiaceae bacterium]|nr:hypothetical protein [Streptosporangiaceae bacterium]